jgi:hypothetical protein
VLNSQIYCFQSGPSSATYSGKKSGYKSNINDFSPLASKVSRYFLPAFILIFLFQMGFAPVLLEYLTRLVNLIMELLQELQHQIIHRQIIIYLMVLIILLVLQQQIYQQLFLVVYLLELIF